MINKTVGRVLIWLGWVLFMLSLFCPAVAIRAYSPDGDSGVMAPDSGARCLLTSLIPTWWLGWPALLLYGAANILMFTTPLLWWKLYGERRVNFAMVVFVAFLLSLVAAAQVEQVYLGYYLWVASFALVSFAFFASAATQLKAEQQQRSGLREAQ